MAFSLPVITTLNPLRNIDVILRLQPELFLAVLIERELLSFSCFNDTNHQMHRFSQSAPTILTTNDVNNRNV